MNFIKKIPAPLLSFTLVPICSFILAISSFIPIYIPENGRVGAAMVLTDNYVWQLSLLGAIQAYRVPHGTQCQVRCPLYCEGILEHERVYANLFPTLVAVLAQRINHFRCLAHNASYMGSLTFIILTP